MAEPEHVDILKKGSDSWNEWRASNPDVAPDLSGVDFETQVHTYKHVHDIAIFRNIDFSNVNLRRTSLRNCWFMECCFNGAEITWSDLCYALFHKCDFTNVTMSVSRMGSAHFQECLILDSRFNYCSAEESSFEGSTIRDSDFSKMTLVGSDFSRAEITRTRVYGSSAWDLKTEGTVQTDIIITDLFENTIAVPSIEVAQFIHVLLTNPKIRDVLDTISSTLVLILGRFSESRKDVLNRFRDELRNHGFVPVIFDFPKPASRSISETVSTLAHLSRLVVADISEPRSVPHELQLIIPTLTSVMIQPIIDSGETPYGMFQDLQSYPWVKELIQYAPGSESSTIAEIVRRVRNEETE